MPAYTRRHLLTRVAPALALAALLPACGQPSAAPTGTPIRQRAAPPAGTPSPATPRPAVAASPSGATATPVATATTQPTPPISSTVPVYQGQESCPFLSSSPSPAPGDPYRWGVISEGAAVSFAERVQKAETIIMGTVRDILPARWATPDGRRPANPHQTYQMLIFTPVRVAVERVAKGDYTLPDIYLAASGGRIGQDCASYTGSGRFPSFVFSERYFYLLSPDRLTALPPIPGDERYRYYSADSSYGVDTTGLVQIGPERDIMGNRADDPPRTLTVDEALREIAALSGQPAGTPTR